MTIRTIHISTGHGPRRQWAVCEGPLALFPMAHPYYSLTHIRTGAAIYRGTLEEVLPMRQALLDAEGINWAFDGFWTMPFATSQRIAAVVNAHRARRYEPDCHQ